MGKNGRRNPSTKKVEPPADTKHIPLSDGDPEEGDGDPTEITLEPPAPPPSEEMGIGQLEPKGGKTGQQPRSHHSYRSRAQGM